MEEPTTAPAEEAPLTSTSPPQSPSSKQPISASPTRSRKRSRTSDPEDKQDTSVTSNASPSQPSDQPRKRPRTVDEKTRTRRLFGSLLGGPPSRPRGAAAPTSHHRESSLTTPTGPKSNGDATLARRASIERRKRDELAARDEEIAGLQAEKLEALTKRRRERQRLVEERDKEREWEGRLNRAGFLVTETEPRIYWVPWEMTGGQKEDVRRRKERVGEEVEEERRRFREEREKREKKTEKETQREEEKVGDVVDSGDKDEDMGRTDGDVDGQGKAASSHVHGDEGEKPASPQATARSRSMSEDEGDNGVDAGEDTVMY
ncbi:hypothetical protein C1H76_0600 [Elsinoe australis]|uniref:Pinin/SDK/MemA protein domain-containing protein n=1 Tax=Elsinoe australis TaxID=40998 RepID=A0A4U7BDM1_9PEZI|nr:hypothetical protein C1H76_0600 [Elsinoe australis]